MSRCRPSLLPVFLVGLLLGGSLTSAWGQTALINGNRVMTGWTNFCPVTTGAVNTYACTLAPAIAQYRIGTRYTFVANLANTGSATINLNLRGATTIKKVVNGIQTNLLANDIQVGQIVDVLYDGTNMQMVSQAGTSTQTIASGTLALPATLVGTGACGTIQTAVATGTLTTDVVLASFNGNITAVTGYTAVTTGSLRVDVYPTANTVNAVVCNNTANNITPSAVVTLNWRVVR